MTPPDRHCLPIFSLGRHSGLTFNVTWKPKSFFWAPWNGSKALIQSGSRAGSGANSALAALHGTIFFGWAALTPNCSRSTNFPGETTAATGPHLSLTDRLPPSPTARPGMFTSTIAGTSPTTAVGATSAWAGQLIDAHPPPQ